MKFACNLLNFFELTTDRYAELRYRHSFEGLILNHMLLLRKLKWRLVANANILYGSISGENKNLAFTGTDSEGNPIRPFFTFDNAPYIEVGYGVENIFKIGQVDFFHRLTYLDHPDVNKFGFKASLRFIL